jgi:riboflavin kinase/FMN adenylyltransferase
MRITHGLPAGGGPHAVTLGNFDGVHLGHQAMLTRLMGEARSRSIPACVMTFEPHPREVFNPQDAPTRLTSLREKLEILRGAGVNRTHVCHFNRSFAALSAAEFIARYLHSGLEARWVLVGDDFRFGAKRSGDFSLLAETGNKSGFAVEAMNSVTLGGTRVSSTAVRDALAAGDMELAARYLGRPYSISGRVVRGDRLGRDIGYPTANIQLKHNRPPVWGIFAVLARGLGPEPVPGVASLGVRPTVHEHGRPVLEAHLFDFSRQIYGEHLTIEFLHKLRDETKFADLSSLVAQIERDAQEARAFLNA